jgi:hypothetical protein
VSSPFLATTKHSVPLTIMLGDDPEDVFDSVTWESPADNGYDAANPSVPQRPGFKQSIEEGEESRGPHDPKWYGYLITHVKDPVKELAETKDAYVSYLVTAKVRLAPSHPLPSILNIHRRTCLSSQPPIPPRGDAFKILSSSEITLLRTFPHV